MSEENVEVIRGAYENFNSGNVPAVLEAMDAEVEWTEPGGGNAPAGTYKGPDSVGSDVFAKIAENFEEFAPVTEEFEDGGDSIVVKGRFSGKSKAGVELDAPFTHTFELSDGKVTKFENETNPGDWAAAWGG
jgi:ketosteroid isomerase-like protein